MIGPSIVIKGELSGEEDLVVDGKVQGKIELAKHSLTIGSKGRVKAEIRARMVTVEGEVEGNIVGTEQVLIKSSGKVLGDVRSPRVALEDGARFKGSIDMGTEEASPAPAKSSVAPLPSAPPAASGPPPPKG